MIYDPIRDDDVVKNIRSKCLSWVGHVVRTDDDRPSKKVFSKALHGQIIKWVHLVNKDTRDTQVERNS
uniref:Uncharacterized protein n=1 Tax=Megaselia scalaris TaxID=36166 RepID=T1GBN8_MEGSC